ncbi:MAG: hypothetical protein KGJ09_05080 [Candidatus Omnitrophica bacterium]|nr:hypothetical protein [Candidatus Omnitrophota bacterium]MDE2009437.1 hypothetical protein [Candidatus Omnitrophota bacterium]MDE2214648.1 hypothetical protein [Candidatus Omnitrophota bacterium]MDE2231809.1 hypothetical protein [Candidatus Omnitrophota bacterium]
MQFKYILILALFAMPVSALSWADDAQQVITLKDGSQIKGVLSGIDNGVYVIKTPIIGDVHVAAGDVASITNGSAAAGTLPAGTAAPAASSGASQGSSFDQRLANTQQQLMSNPQDMQIIMQMAQDPQIAQALQDPAVMQAVTSHDYQALANNPAIQQLMNNPHMQELIKQMAGQQQQQNSTSQ